MVEVDNFNKYLIFYLYLVVGDVFNIFIMFI